MDQELTEDGKPFAPIRYKQIAKECYLISKNTNTSYTDVLKITPVERRYIIGFLLEEAKQNEERIQQMKQEAEARKRNR